MNSLKLFSPNNFLWSLKIIFKISIDFLLISFLILSSSIGNNLIISLIIKINLPIWKVIFFLLKSFVKTSSNNCILFSIISFIFSLLIISLIISISKSQMKFILSKL